MEQTLFVILMVVGHMLMMFVMPGMHGGHNHKEHSNAEREAEERKKLEIENKQLREELNTVKSQLNRNRL